MLTALSIRDVVLIERLDLGFGTGLTVLTGETGAGKSILLDSLGLALGVRADAGLVRAGATQASVVASFSLPGGHPAHALLDKGGIAAEPGEELVLRRAVTRDGRSRAFVNDQPVGVALLRRLGTLLIEISGQHDQMGLADPAGHTALLDAYGVPETLRREVATRHRVWRDAAHALRQARDAIAAAEREEDWLRHTVGELAELAAQPGEEEQLAHERSRLQQGERRGEAIAAALSELTPRDRRNAGPAAALRAAARALGRLAPAGAEDSQAAPALAALERAEEALAEAETLLSRLVQDAGADPRALELAEERLFGLRAAARKHATPVAELPALLTTLHGRLQALETGAAGIVALEAESRAARASYDASASRLTQAREDTAVRLAKSVSRELPPLRLERARFFAELLPLQPEQAGPQGAESVRFLIATNPGQAPGALGRVASGGELSRLMLALKVVLASGSPVPTLVFDEVDAGIGGATAAAVGDRLSKVAEGVQVLVVTHSPQVAARGGAHLMVAKREVAGRTETRVLPLDGAQRREEIARMLAGETVTEAARAAADSLLGAA